MKTLIYKKIARHAAAAQGYLPPTDHSDIRFQLVREPGQPLPKRPDTHPSLLIDVLAILGPITPDSDATSVAS